MHYTLFVAPLRWRASRERRAVVRRVYKGDDAVSIVRIGLAETKHFGEGYDAIFGKKKAAAPTKPAKKAKKSAGAKAKKAAPKKKVAKKK